ncbi:PLP-dependent aminotransferase family protein [Hyphomicrobium sp. D-2]|uniref:MocR-like pyridoxine biosynthesis transcription factor PdxR n=1 Tax=Hyphomicrobium sp. D-2 TaxID=3041621 RepID=UPI002455FD51|nr:PLP-dependent aminotransferase family protein [Hyphomicrobium sp. D-2]MDH4982174.1 PLP-dependent aminotransferase family protein [Hyphomicrobium sp. D-2]
MFGAKLDWGCKKMQLPILIDRASEVPIQSQIVSQIRDLIDRGFLSSGTRVPSSRELSEQLGVARRTIMLAYEKLNSEGYLETRQSSATVVCELNPRLAIHVDTAGGSHSSDRLPTPPATDMAFAHINPNLYIPSHQRPELDFSIGRPDHRLFPQKAWQRLMFENFAAHARVISEYPDPRGYLDLRIALREHLRKTRGIVCSENQIIIVSGAQDGLNLVVRLLSQPNSSAIVEDPCYHGAAIAFETSGVKLIPAAVDHEGIVVDDWPKEARLIYVTPSHQFPYGMTMSLERREKLLSWVYKSDAYVIEDDYDGDFRYNSSPLFSLSALDQSNRVIYLGTFSKSIGPGLRVGYVVFPQHLADAANDLKAVMSNGLPTLSQAVIAQLIRSGAFERHIAVMRRQYLARRDTLIAGLLKAFPKSRISGEEGGMHLIWALGPNHPSAQDLASKCKDAGVGIYPVGGSPICKSFSPANPRDVMLGYTPLTEEQISQAVGRIEHVLLKC